jgi:hypothetical protein
LSIFPLLEPQNIIWTPFQYNIIQKKIWIRFPLYFIFQNGWKQKSFHSFWTCVPVLNPTKTSGRPLRHTFIKKK